MLKRILHGKYLTKFPESIGLSIIACAAEPYLRHHERQNPETMLGAKCCHFTKYYKATQTTSLEPVHTQRKWRRNEWLISESRASELKWGSNILKCHHWLDVDLANRQFLQFASSFLYNFLAASCSSWTVHFRSQCSWRATAMATNLL